MNSNTHYTIKKIIIMKDKISSRSGVALGILLGVVVGVAQDNIGLWICFGLAIGVAIDNSRKKESSKK